jgi:hypothetical protein
MTNLVSYNRDGYSSFTNDLSKKKSFIVPISVGRNIICNIQCNCDSNIYSYLFTLISEILAIRLINQKEKKSFINSIEFKFNQKIRSVRIIERKMYCLLPFYAI